MSKRPVKRKAEASTSEIKLKMVKQEDTSEEMGEAPKFFVLTPEQVADIAASGKLIMTTQQDLSKFFSSPLSSSFTQNLIFLFFLVDLINFAVQQGIAPLVAAIDRLTKQVHSLEAFLQPDSAKLIDMSEFEPAQSYAELKKLDEDLADKFFRQKLVRTFLWRERQRVDLNEYFNNKKKFLCFRFFNFKVSPPRRLAKQFVTPSRPFVIPLNCTLNRAGQAARRPIRLHGKS